MDRLDLFNTELSPEERALHSMAGNPKRSWVFFFFVEFNVPPTPKRIWRRGPRSQEVGGRGAIPNTTLSPPE